MRIKNNLLRLLSRVTWLLIALNVTLFLAVCKALFTTLNLNFFIINSSYQTLTKKSTGDKELWGGYYGI
jgi:hypothetical protein